MASDRKFHKYVYHVEVLSEEEIGSFDLGELYDLITFGPCSGRFLNTDHFVLDGRRTAELLVEHGCDPEFFSLDESGNDVDI